MHFQYKIDKYAYNHDRIEHPKTENYRANLCHRGRNPQFSHSVDCVPPPLIFS